MYGISPSFPPMTVSYLPLGPADVEIIRGNNHPPLQFQFLEDEDPDVLFDLTGSVFKLRLSWGGNAVLTVSSDVDASLDIDLSTSVVSWNYTVAESRSLPLGRKVLYELERWIDGTQRTMARGTVCVSEGYNPD